MYIRLVVYVTTQDRVIVINYNIRWGSKIVILIATISSKKCAGAQNCLKNTRSILFPEY